jgi:hypothetical protein
MTAEALWRGSTATDAGMSCSPGTRSIVGTRARIASPLKELDEWPLVFNFVACDGRVVSIALL